MIEVTTYFVQIFSIHSFFYLYTKFMTEILDGNKWIKIQRYHVFIVTAWTMKKHRIFLVLVLLAILFSFTVVNCKWLLVAENDTFNEKGFEPINQSEDIKNLEKNSNEDTKARQVLSLL